MVNQAKKILSLAGILLPIACGGGSSKKATNMSVPEMEPPVSANTPSSLGGSGTSLLLADNSPKLCDSPDCPTVAGTVKARLFGQGSGLVNLLNAMDMRITELEQRSSGSFVACMADEEGNLKEGSAYTFNFTSKHSFVMRANCHDPYSGPAGGEPAGQMVFGRDSSDSYYIFDRYRQAADNVRSIVGKQDQSENVEAWAFSYQTLNAAQTGGGAILHHLKSTKDTGTVEFATAGTAKFSGVDLVCGVRVKYNTQFLYISGKIGAPSTQQTTGLGCDGITSANYCLSATDFSVQEDSQCSGAGLTTFTIDAIAPSDLDYTTFKEKVDLDLSTVTSQFTSESIEEGQGPI